MCIRTDKQSGSSNSPFPSIQEKRNPKNQEGHTQEQDKTIVKRSTFGNKPKNNGT